MMTMMVVVLVMTAMSSYFYCVLYSILMEIAHPILTLNSPSVPVGLSSVFGRQVTTYYQSYATGSRRTWSLHAGPLDDGLSAWSTLPQNIHAESGSAQRVSVLRYRKEKGQ